METNNSKSGFISFINKHPILVISIISIFTGIVSLVLFFPGFSPLYPLNSTNHLNQDINYYLYVGKEMNMGKLPYIDLADQKGLITYYLFAFSMKYGGIHMVRFLHIILIGLLCFFILLCIWELTKHYAFILIGTGIYSIFFIITGYGPAIGLEVAFVAAISIYLYIKAIKRDSNVYFLLGSFIGGIEIGLAFGTRPTDGFVILPIYLFYFIYFLRHKTKFELLYNALVAILGFIIPVLAIIFAAGQGGYLKEMIEVNYINGIRYGFTQFYHAKIIISIILVLLIPLYIYIGIRFIKDKENADIGIFIMVMGLGNILLNLTIARFKNYFQSTTPLIVLTIITYFYYYPFRKRDHKLKYAFTIATTTVSLIVSLGYVSFYYLGDGRFSEKYNLALKEEVRRSIPNVEELKENELYAIDVNSGILLDIDYKSSCKYQAYQSWQAESNMDLCDEYVSFMEKSNPTYILWCEADRQDYYEMPHIKFVTEYYTEITSELCGYSNIKIFKINL